MTEWALLAQSYIIQLISCLVNFFRKPMEETSALLLHAFCVLVNIVTFCSVKTTSPADVSVSMGVKVCNVLWQIDG